MSDVQPHQPLSLRPWVAPQGSTGVRPRLALSTICGQARLADLGDLVDEARRLGIDRLALGPHCTPDQVEQVIARLGDDVRLCSLHVVCPHPLTDDDEPAALPSLADPDPLLGEVIVRWAEETIRLASYWGVPSVVLDLDEPYDPALSLATGAMSLRTDNLSVHGPAVRADRLNAARGRLDDLVLLCEEAGVRLALRTPAASAALPQPDELADLLAACDSRQLAYWHDVGRAGQVAAQGGASADAWLPRFSDRLAGFYLDGALPDAPRADREPPRQGSADPAAALRWATAETPCVLALPGAVGVDALADALAAVRQWLPTS